MQANDLPVVAQAVSPAYRISSHLLSERVAAQTFAAAPRRRVSAMGHDTAADGRRARQLVSVARHESQALAAGAMAGAVRRFRNIVAILLTNPPSQQ